MKILDACCGSKMFWFDKEHKETVYMDKRTLDTTLCDGRKLIDEINTFDFRGNLYDFGGFVKRAKRIKGSVKLNEKEKEYYMRIGCMKWVNR